MFQVVELCISLIGNIYPGLTYKMPCDKKFKNTNCNFHNWLWAPTELIVRNYEGISQNSKT